MLNSNYNHPQGALLSESDYVWLCHYYEKIKRMTETEKEEEEGKNTDNFKDYIVADYTTLLDYKIA